MKTEEDMVCLEPSHARQPALQLAQVSLSHTHTYIQTHTDSPQLFLSDKQIAVCVCV